MAPRDRVFLWTAPLVAAQWFLIVVLDPDAGSRFAEKVSFGFFFGGLLGQTTLAAAWTALGPGLLIWRLPLSVIWVFLLALAIALNIGLHGGPPIQAALAIGLCLLGQWALLQFPLWGLVLGFGLHLQHVDEEQQFDPRRRQFGIRQLIIVTAIVGVALGCGRMVISALGDNVNLVNRETPIFVFLSAATGLVSLPLLLAVLMRPLSVPALGLAILLIGLVTACELPLLQMLQAGPGPDVGDFIAINAFTSTMMLMVLAMVRRCGYRLARSAQDPSC